MSIWFCYNGSVNTAKIHTDASVPGNPGPMRIGYIIQTLSGEVVARVGQSVGDGTVNIAEYLAIIASLRHAFRLGFRSIQLDTDSQLVARQLSGRFKVKDKKLARLYREIKSLVPAFDAVKIKWVPREENNAADALSRESVFEELDHGPRPATKAGHPKALHDWQAVRVREALKRGATEYALGRAFSLPATSVRLIGAGKTYQNATADLMPSYDVPSLFPAPLVSSGFEAPSVYTTTGENDEAPQTQPPAGLIGVSVDVRGDVSGETE